MISMAETTGANLTNFWSMPPAQIAAMLENTTPQQRQQIIDATTPKEIAQSIADTGINTGGEMNIFRAQFLDQFPKDFKPNLAGTEFEKYSGLFANNPGIFKTFESKVLNVVNYDEGAQRAPFGRDSRFIETDIPILGKDAAEQKTNAEGFIKEIKTLSRGTAAQFEIVEKGGKTFVRTYMNEETFSVLGSIVANAAKLELPPEELVGRMKLAQERIWQNPVAREIGRKPFAGTYEMAALFLPGESARQRMEINKTTGRLEKAEDPAFEQAEKYAPERKPAPDLFFHKGEPVMYMTEQEIDGRVTYSVSAIDSAKEAFMETVKDKAKEVLASPDGIREIFFDVAEAIGEAHSILGPIVRSGVFAGVLSAKTVGAHLKTSRAVNESDERWIDTIETMQRTVDQAKARTEEIAQIMQLPEMEQVDPRIRYSVAENIFDGRELERQKEERAKAKGEPYVPPAESQAVREQQFIARLVDGNPYRTPEYQNMVADAQDVAKYGRVRPDLRASLDAPAVQSATTAVNTAAPEVVSHGLTNQQKNLYLRAVITGTGAMLGGKAANNVSPLMIDATLNPLERLDAGGNRIRNFHTFGHVTRSAEEIVPAMQQVRTEVEDYIRDNTKSLSGMDNATLNDTLSKVYAASSFKAFDVPYDKTRSIADNLVENDRNPNMSEMKDASGLNKTGVTHDVVYNVDGMADPKWLEYVTKGDNALLQLTPDGKALEWNARGKESLAYKLIAPMKSLGGLDRPINLEGGKDALGPYPTNFASAPVYNELLSAITEQQQDLDQKLPQSEQLRRSVEIMGTYYSKTPGFGDELYDRFSKLGTRIGMSQDSIRDAYESALTFTNKADVKAFRGGTGLKSDIQRLSRFVDELEPSAGTRNDATVTTLDRANVGAEWFTHDIAVTGLIKNMTQQLGDEKVPAAQRQQIKNYLKPYLNENYNAQLMKPEQMIDSAKLDKTFGPGTYAAYEKVQPLEIFRGLPQAAMPVGESPNNYVIATENGKPITKLEGNFSALKSTVAKLRTIQAITATEMLNGALLEQAGQGATPAAKLNLAPLNNDNITPAANLDIGVMERLRNPDFSVNVFGETRAAGHPNDVIAASLLERVGPEKVAELAIKQQQVVMGARFMNPELAKKYGNNSLAALKGEAQDIIDSAEAILGKDVVGEFRQNVKAAADALSGPVMPVVAPAAAPVKVETQAKVKLSKPQTEYSIRPTQDQAERGTRTGNGYATGRTPEGGAPLFDDFTGMPTTVKKPAAKPLPSGPMSMDPLPDGALAQNGPTKDNPADINLMKKGERDTLNTLLTDADKTLTTEFKASGKTAYDVLSLDNEKLKTMSKSDYKATLKTAYETLAKTDLTTQQLEVAKAAYLRLSIGQNSYDRRVDKLADMQMEKEPDYNAAKAGSDPVKTLFAGKPSVFETEIPGAPAAPGVNPSPVNGGAGATATPQWDSRNIEGNASGLYAGLAIKSGIEYVQNFNQMTTTQKIEGAGTQAVFDSSAAVDFGKWLSKNPKFAGTVGELATNSAAGLGFVTSAYSTGHDVYDVAHNAMDGKVSDTTVSAAHLYQDSVFTAATGSTALKLAVEKGVPGAARTLGMLGGEEGTTMVIGAAASKIALPLTIAQVAFSSATYLTIERHTENLEIDNQTLSDADAGMAKTSRAGLNGPYRITKDIADSLPIEPQQSDYIQLNGMRNRKDADGNTVNVDLKNDFNGGKQLVDKYAKDANTALNEREEARSNQGSWSRTSLLGAAVNAVTPGDWNGRDSKQFEHGQKRLDFASQALGAQQELNEYSKRMDTYQAALDGLNHQDHAQAAKDYSQQFAALKDLQTFHYNVRMAKRPNEMGDLLDQMVTDVKDSKNSLTTQQKKEQIDALESTKTEVTAIQKVIDGEVEKTRTTTEQKLGLADAQAKLTEAQSKSTQLYAEYAQKNRNRNFHNTTEGKALYQSAIDSASAVNGFKDSVDKVQADVTKATNEQKQNGQVILTQYFATQLGNINARKEWDSVMNMTPDQQAAYFQKNATFTSLPGIQGRNDLSVTGLSASMDELITKRMSDPAFAKEFPDKMKQMSDQNQSILNEISAASQKGVLPVNKTIVAGMEKLQQDMATAQDSLQSSIKASNDLAKSIEAKDANGQLSSDDMAAMRQTQKEIAQKQQMLQSKQYASIIVGNELLTQANNERLAQKSVSQAQTTPGPEDNTQLAVDDMKAQGKSLANNATPAPAKANNLSALADMRVIAAEPEKDGEVIGAHVAVASDSIMLDKKLDKPAPHLILKSEPANIPTGADAVGVSGEHHQQQHAGNT
jgi:hypothetical protein